MFSRSNILKLSLFATGLSGIVAEYILATLATYFLGNSVFQWTMVLSVMLFSMGLGSRISKQIETRLLERFILIEFTLSILVSFSALAAYVVAAHFAYTSLVIYGFSVIIGALIGMEIPLVIRLNDEFEELKVNVSNVMEKDYYGSLLGGVFFVFFGLPYLGLTYTPFLLGTVNFVVAILLLFSLKSTLKPNWKKRLYGTTLAVAIIIGAGAFFAKPIILFGEQTRYKDKVIYTDQSQYQNLVVTQYKGNYWFYINGNQQLSTLDEWMYHEPLVHPAMKLHANPENVLILGGGDGCAAREVLKYESVQHIKLVDLDPKVTELAKTHPIFTELNENALENEKVEVLNGDAYTYLEATQEYFDVIVIDFPDPKSIELGRLYSYEFYRMCYKQLRPNGVIVVQSGSPYYATKAFACIEKTIAAAGFQTIPIHNQVLTLGQWGWTIGAKSIPKDTLKPLLRQMTFDGMETRWINNDAMSHITSFGKSLVKLDTAKIEVNRIHNPVLSAYYRQGNWQFY
ncbi:MAG: polyamine aminopropyltransferase [Aureispira sp.]|nr:polyamine aminopropyltransferase [Aureispira sp.]